MALPIWGLYMKKCYENEALGISLEDFIAPRIKNSCVYFLVYNCSSYLFFLLQSRKKLVTIAPQCDDGARS